MRCTQASWLTPSEIFTPYYGRAIANYILDKHCQMAEPGSKLSILEIGGGTGTLARDVLDHVRSAAPQSYAECSYTSVEISPQLAQVQQHTVADTAGHASHYQVLNNVPTASQIPMLQAGYMYELILRWALQASVSRESLSESIHGLSTRHVLTLQLILAAGGVQGCWGSCRMEQQPRPDIHSYDGGPRQLPP